MDPNSCKLVQGGSVDLSLKQNALQTQLDNLIVSYLDLIDTYTKLQKDISQDLSSGFLSIAQANFSSNTSRRYGEDFYDNRMKAMKGVEISLGSSVKFPGFKLIDIPLEDEEVIISEKEADSEKDKASGIRRRKAAQEEPTEEKSTHDSTTNRNDETQGVPTEDKPTSLVALKDPRDPIKWFGVLVSPALKNAQRRFSNALPLLPDLVTLLGDLNWHEDEIRKVRRQINNDRINEMGREIGEVTLTDTMSIEKGSPSAA